MNSEARPTKPRWLKIVKLSVRLLILSLLAYGIWHSVRKGLDDLRAQDFSWSHINPWWLLVSSLAYFAGTIPSGLFWHKTLWVMGQQPTRFEALRAFTIGHLGKYVPGKALVIVLRAGLVRGPRCNTTVAATAVFIETLTSMAVGAFVAATMAAVMFYDRPKLLLLAAALMVCTGVPILPPVFRRAVRILGVRKINPDIDQALAGLTYRLMAYGWLRLIFSWFLYGFSLWATLRAYQPPGAAPVSLQQWPFATVCYALAILAGFVIMVPGGLGVREWVVTRVLAEPFGPGRALVSAVLVRLASLVAESVFAGILYLLKPRDQGPADSEPRVVALDKSANGG